MKKLLLTLCTLTILIGCVPPKQIETLGVITTSGIDLLEDGWIHNILLYTQFDPDVQEPMQTVESKANTYQGTLDVANLKTNYKLVSGQIRLKVFGKEMAKTGVMRLLNAHFRDAEEPIKIYITVSETTAKDVLNSNSSIDLSKFLFNLVDSNIKQEVLPRSDLFDFLHKYSDIGIDPIQPLVTIEKQRPVIEAIALFQNDVYVESLTPKETFLIKLITENFKAGRQEVTLPKEPFKEFARPSKDKNDDEYLYITLNEIRSKSKLTLEDKKNLKYNVDIKLDSRLMEISEPLRIENEKVLNKLEQHITENMNSTLDQLIEKLKELNVDPIGFGTIYNQETRDKELTEEKWRDLYPNIEVNFNVDVNIIRHGIME